MFGKFKGRLFYEADEDSNLKSWLDWLAESSNEKSAMMGRWYLVQLEAGAGPQDAVLVDLEIQEGEDGAGSGLVVFQAPEIGHYKRLVEAARSRLADLELEYGIDRSKVDSIQATLFGALRPFYQERDRLRLLIQYRKIFIDRLLSEGDRQGWSCLRPCDWRFAVGRMLANVRPAFRAVRSMSRECERRSRAGTSHHRLSVALHSHGPPGGRSLPR